MDENVLCIGSDVAQCAALKELPNEYKVICAAHLSNGLRQFSQRPGINYLKKGIPAGMSFSMVPR